MRIIFFGTSEFAIPALQTLIQNGAAPIAIVTTPDRPKGRSQRLASPPIKEWLKKIDPDKSGAVLQPEMIDSAFITYILNLKPDVGIVAAYGKILPKALVELFPHGILNIHPSLLPKYRGPSPIQATILNGDAKTGVTIIQIDEKMDHGPIIAQQRLNLQTLPQNNSRETSPQRKDIYPFFPPLLGKERGLEGEVNSFVPQKITYPKLHDALAKLGAQLLMEALPKWIARKITPKPQDDTRATYTKLLKKEDGKIDWSKSAEEIECMVRAYNPWPGSYTNIEKVGLLKIKEALTSPLLPLLTKEGAERGINLFLGGGFAALPGTFFKTPNGFPAVVCGKNALKLLVVQPEGKKEMPGDVYLRGHRYLL